MRLLFSALILAVVLSAVSFAFAADDLHVEGISYDSANPSESIAVINGEFLKEGSVYSGYKILKIDVNSVDVVHRETGETKKLQISGSAPPQLLPQIEQTPATPEEPSVESVAKQAYEGTAKPPSAWNFNPFDMIKLAQETAIFAAMKQIHMAAMAHQAHEGEIIGLDGKAPPRLTIQKLIERDVISDVYGGEYKGYKFGVNAKYDDVEVTADPVNPDSKLKHYLVDRHGIIRYEVGKPATSKSPPRNI